MYNQTRKKIVLNTMLALIFTLVVTLSAVIVSFYFSIRRQSAEMLDKYVELYDLEKQPGMSKAPEIGKDSSEVPPMGDIFRVSLFYSVAISDTGEILAFDDGRTTEYNKEVLAKMAKEIMDAGETAGTKGCLEYRIDRREGYTLAVFLDNTEEEVNLSILKRNALLAGSGSLLVLFFLVSWLSGRIVRPLEENDRRQRQFVSDVGHELKSPIAIVSANAELLEQKTGQSRWLDNIRAENTRMGELVTSLLDLLRAESASAPIEEVDLSEIVTSEVLLSEVVAYEKDRTIIRDITLGLYMNGNRTFLSRLIAILLDNAISYSEGGREIDLVLDRQGNAAKLSVTNSCKNLTSEQQLHLFDRFYRVDTARSGKDNHYGLGLPIAKSIVEFHGGSISVKSLDGTITFTVILPLKNS